MFEEHLEKRSILGIEGLCWQICVDSRRHMVFATRLSLLVSWPDVSEAHCPARTHVQYVSLEGGLRETSAGSFGNRLLGCTSPVDVALRNPKGGTMNATLQDPASLFSIPHYQIGNENEGSKVTTADDKVSDVSVMLLGHVWRKRQRIRRFSRVCGTKRGKISSSCRLPDLPQPLPKGEPQQDPPKVFTSARRVGYTLRSHYPVHWVEL